MEWTPAELAEWCRAHPPDLGWLERPARHSFRWRDASGRWHVADGRVSSSARLLRALDRHPPRDAYVGTASWLDPVRLPRLRDAASPAPVLLDHLVVFDLDAAPWSLRRLDAAREAARRLLGWMAKETGLSLVHVTYSGAKGFHVVARDPDRSLFLEPDPRRREALVRASRQALLRRVLDAGHPVDPTVTADTRRVIRLPGTLHGTTGWACSVLPADALERPVAEWLPTLPRHPRARMPPRWSFPRMRALRLRLPRLATPAATPARLEMQASTHVPGTRDRSALLAWLPSSWSEGGTDRIERALRDARLGPALLWRKGDRLLLLVPRAIPRARLARVAPRFALQGLPSTLDARGHAWAAVAPSRWDDGVEDVPLEPLGILVGAPCRHPWSRAHLDLARRLGQPLEMDGVGAGSERARLRLAEIR